MCGESIFDRADYRSGIEELQKPLSLRPDTLWQEPVMAEPIKRAIALLRSGQPMYHVSVSAGRHERRRG